MGKEHNAIFFQAATLITVFPYTLPIYLKSTMPTYYFTVYPQTLFKRQIFISLVSFSTSPIPQLPKRSVVQHTCKWSHDYANLGDREKLRYILYTEVLIFKEWRQHSISSTFHLFIPFSFKRRQVSFLYISLEELYTTGMEKNNGENRCMNTCFSTKHKVTS